MKKERSTTKTSADSKKSAKEKSIKTIPNDKKTNAILTSTSLDPLKKDMVRQTIITILWKKDEVTLPRLVEELNKEIGRHFNGDIDQYIEAVKIELEAKKVLEQAPEKEPVHYRLTQKLDSEEKEGDEKEGDEKEKDEKEGDEQP